MITRFRKLQVKGELYLVILLLCSALFFALTVKNMQARPAGSMANGRYTLVIDPGHGGIDGGAIALNGAKESDINLAIALKLQKLAEFYGYPPVMTRTDDQKRADMSSYSEHEDLVYRTQLINAVPHGVLLSIHQNSYPTSQPSGAQVLYAKGESSRRLGELTHSKIVSTLQQTNRRVAEPAPGSLYITANARCPAILVECGFVSNPFDLDDLMDSGYQTAFAAVLLASFVEFDSQTIKT